MGASQPTTSANRQTNTLTTGYNSSTSLADTDALTLDPAVNVSAGYAGSLSSEPANSLSTSAGIIPVTNYKRGTIMKWIIFIALGVGLFYVYKKGKK